MIFGGRIGTRLTLGILLGALSVSLAVNVVLYRFSLDRYRSEMALRLDPTGQREFQDSSTRVPASPGKRVVLFGDSRLAQWQPLPSMPGVQIVNRARPGETPEQALERIERDVLALSPDAVVVQYGVNSLKAIGVFPEREASIIQSCDLAVRRLVRRLADRSVAVVVLTIFPVGTIPLARRPVWSERTREAVDRVNAGWLKDLGGPGIWIVDADEWLREKGKRQVRSELAADDLHLNGQGYVVLNAGVVPLLSRILKDR